jgi:tetratricopeptide (TPR) repeat protein
MILERGLELYNESKYLDAIPFLKKYSQQNPKELSVLIALGDAYEKTASLKLALQYYQKALVLDPVNSGILISVSNLELTGKHYLDVIKDFHDLLKPRNYIEIGVFTGVSFRLTDENTRAIGIDPDPKLNTNDLPKKHLLVKDTSDNYFSNNRIEKDFSGESIDLSFIDGLHLFENALKDFMNLERYSSSSSTILIHDMYPINAESSQRERITDFWTGDVWKLALCLKEYRPDLDFKINPCPPSGIGVITNLDSTSNILSENFDDILKKYINLPYEDLCLDDFK